jgi:hypothetical protein
LPVDFCVSGRANARAICCGLAKRFRWRAKTITASPTPREEPKQQIELECNLNATEQEALNDPIKQEQYRKEYLRQLRLRSCPGCGETELF